MTADTPADRGTSGLAGLKPGRVRGVWRHPDVSWNNVASLADSLALSDHRARRLYLQLSRARSIFDGWTAIHSTPKKSAIAARLNEMEQSIVRIAREAQATDPRFEAARSVMGHEGENWAASRDPMELQYLGFCARELGNGSLYGASDVIHRWFKTAPFILYSLRQARSRCKEGDDLADHWRGEPGAKEWLIGKRLPEIYEMFSGKRFGKSKQGDQLTNTGGLAFIAASHKAIGLGPIALETIGSHRRNFRLRS